MIVRALGTALALLALAHGANAARLDSAPARDLVLFDRAPSLALSIDGRDAVGDRIAAVAMPNARLSLRVRDAEAARLVLRTAGHGVIERETDDGWIWQAPDSPGVYTLAVLDRQRATRSRIQVLVMTPFGNDRPSLDGYRIGRYEPEALRSNAATAPPAGLVQVTRANRDTQVSPHFTLGEFLCHQQPDHWPKYVLVQPRLLDKLERLHVALADAGFPQAEITVMSGYRTPWYNADIGNTTVYSQHLFGGAADVFVDTDGDGRMDDLNADGRVDTADARWLADLVETVTAEYPALVGGLSAYSANAYHGPFVHLDVRGVAARW